MDYQFNTNYLLSVGGKDVQVNYKGLYNGLVVHFEFKGETISPTAYRSHFLFVDDLLRMKQPSVLDAAKSIANDLYNEYKINYLPENFNEKQLTLF